jgi:thermitase
MLYPAGYAQLARHFGPVLMSVGLLALSTGNAIASPIEVVSGQYLLKTANIAHDSAANSVLSPLAVRVDSGRVIVQHGGLQTRLLQMAGNPAAAFDAQGSAKAMSKRYAIYDPAQAKADCAALKQNNPAILNCEPNFVLRAAVSPNDPGLSYLWAMNKISAPTGWDTATGSRDVVVAVIDSGIDYTHPDLAANMWINTGEIPDNGIDDDDDGYIDDIYGINTADDSSDPADDNGHGTHCAGTIGAVGNNGVGVVGVNWQVSLMAGKFLGSDGSGSNAAAIEAIAYAVDHGANVISASWGGGDNSRELYDAIAYARDQGVLFVTAAGNDGKNNDSTHFYPASYSLSNIIAVAATDANDQLASFSNYGASSVHVAAPGVDIISTYPGGQYASMSGTSMATPHVAGLAALIKSLYPDMTASELKSRILNGDTISALKSKTTSGKRININKALTGPAGGSNGASIISLTGSHGTNLLYSGEAFSTSLSGGANDQAKLSIQFFSSSNKSLGKCSLGNATFAVDGTLSLAGLLSLGGSLGKTAAKATFTADHSSAKRKIHLRARDLQRSRTSALRVQQDLKKTCRDIKLSLTPS